MSEPAPRNRVWLPWLALIVAAVLVVGLLRLLPLREWVEQFAAWVGELGMWGPAVFALGYILAVVLMVPVWILTITAGAVFGLGGGLIIASLASTTGAALALLIGRYFARHRVMKLAARYPRFDALDRAITTGGWKIIALLRLSPMVPFNLQNYFYGLTGIGFWTCVLTSWVTMLPGTLAYVYIGYLGREGIEDTDAGPWVWTLRIVGFAATVAVLLYLTRLARRELDRRINDHAAPEPPDSPDHPSQHPEEQPEPR